MGSGGGGEKIFPGVFGEVGDLPMRVLLDRDDIAQNIFVFI